METEGSEKEKKRKEKKKEKRKKRKEKKEGGLFTSELLQEVVDDLIVQRRRFTKCYNMFRSNCVLIVAYFYIFILSYSHAKCVT